MRVLVQIEKYDTVKLTLVVLIVSTQTSAGNKEARMQSRNHLERCIHFTWRDPSSRADRDQRIVRLG